jgi:hypothetical protein
MHNIETVQTIDLLDILQSQNISYKSTFFLFWHETCNDLFVTASCMIVFDNDGRPEQNISFVVFSVPQ